MKNKLPFDGLWFEPISVDIRTDLLLTSIRTENVDLVVEEWEPVKDAEDNDFFKVTFE